MPQQPLRTIQNVSGQPIGLGWPLCGRLSVRWTERGEEAAMIGMKRREFSTLLVARPRRGRSRRARSGLGEATDRKEAHSTHRTFSAPSISSARATASNNRPLAS